MSERFGPLVGGLLCLDFVNTVRCWARPETSTRAQDTGPAVVDGERLTDYAALAAWSVYSRTLGLEDARVLLANADQRPHDAAAVLARALAAREALHRVLTASIAARPAPSDHLATLNREVLAGRRHEVIAATGASAPRKGRRRVETAGPGFRWAWVVDEAALDCMLWPVMRSAGELLTSNDLARVGQCAGENCGWLFLDTSRSGRRRWCDMAVCGNTAKVRRFRERRRDAR